MTRQEQILRDLRAGQTTIDSLASRLQISHATAHSILHQLIQQNKVETQPLARHPHLKIFRLTEKGFQT